MSKRATTIKSVHDPGYLEFQTLARAAIASNRLKKQRLNNAATQIQRKVRKKKGKKKRMQQQKFKEK